MKSYKYINYKTIKHIAILTLNRPEVMNALNREITLEIHEILEQLPSFFPEIRVLIITGSGKGFCSGADLSRMATIGSENRKSNQASNIKRIQELAPAIRNIPQPVISAVNGPAVGAGLSIALASDIRIASDKASFSAIFVKRGLVPDTAASATLNSIAGHSVAAEMALTGNSYDAIWALSKGLISDIVPAKNLIDETVNMAQNIAGNPPLAVRQTKKLLRYSMPDWADIIAEEDDSGDMLYDTKDKKESVQAFLEKRTPNYTGK
jgi:2-(1,2-epoxy-1,2-dihydrophenyl)acetyl-CoA isomerase